MENSSDKGNPINQQVLKKVNLGGNQAHNI
jgi:hypothetical protein